MKTSETDGAPWASWTSLLPPVPPSFPGVWVSPVSKVTHSAARFPQPSHPQFPDLQTGIRELKLKPPMLWVLSDNTGSLKSVLSLGSVRRVVKVQAKCAQLLNFAWKSLPFYTTHGSFFPCVPWSFFYYKYRTIPSL